MERGKTWRQSHARHCGECRNQSKWFVVMLVASVLWLSATTSLLIVIYYQNVSSCLCVCVCVCVVSTIYLTWPPFPCRPGNEVMYGFAHFTSSLNELEPGIAPTDCRFRPDQRIMEEGDFPRADKEKVWCSMHSIPTVVIRLLEVVSSAGYKNV